MGCHALLNDRGAVIGHLCRPGARAEKPISKRGRWKWCFNCCKRLRHMLTMSYDLEPSYYGPSVYWKCSGCGKDFTLFPGRFYE